MDVEVRETLRRTRSFFSLRLQLFVGTAGLVLGPPASYARQPARVLLIYDLEGVIDVVAPGTTVDADGYEAARESLTEDVNAAIRGLLEGGASEVVLAYGHGSGNPQPDYLMDPLPPGARHEIRDQPYDPYVDVVDRSYAAVVAIGMHAGSGEMGFLPHTVLSHTRWIANGVPLNESAIVAASAARYDVPLILVTGDDVLEQEIGSFSSKTAYVTVKTARSLSAAEPRPREEVDRDIASAAKRAFLETRVPPWNDLSNAPLRNEVGYRTPEQTALAALYPGVRVLNDKAIWLESPSFLENYLLYRALAHYTFLAHMRWIVENFPDVEGRGRSRPAFRKVPTSLRADLPRLARHPSVQRFWQVWIQVKSRTSSNVRRRDACVLDLVFSAGSYWPRDLSAEPHPCGVPVSFHACRG